MAASTPHTPQGYLDRLLAGVQLDRTALEMKQMVNSTLTEVTEDVSAEDRFISGVAALLYNVEPLEGRFDRGKILESIRHIDDLVNKQINEVLHHAQFQQLESSWTGLAELVENVNFKANICIDLLDVSRDELFDDFENNASDILGSALFQKVYVAEYDMYGGRPFGALLGIYEFNQQPRDLQWLRSMSKIAAASHAPFIASVSPQFFGCENVEEMEAVRDLDGVLSQPRYSRWNLLRDADEAAYLGLTFPRYVLRLPWNSETNPSPGLPLEEDAQGDRSRYLWGSSVWLLARNLVRSFEQSGWCQYIRGPLGGGLLRGLPVDSFNVRGETEFRSPIEIAIPDYRELEFARNGFIPLIYRKASSDAAFFSVQSIKRAKRFRDHKDAQNAQLVTNLAYTFSITRVAHYLKTIARDYIGSSADSGFLEKLLTTWLTQYVTTNVNPDDLTLRRFPFRAVAVKVLSRPAEVGWYDCQVSVLPHIQFEGINIELRIESRLG